MEKGNQPEKANASTESEQNPPTIEALLRELKMQRNYSLTTLRSQGRGRGRLIAICILVVLLVLVMFILYYTAEEMEKRPERTPAVESVSSTQTDTY